MLLGDEVLLTGPAPAPGQTITVRLRAFGASPTTLSAKAWVVGDAEPADWQVTRTDGAAGLQGPGAVGVRASVSGLSITTAPVTFAVDDLHATTAK